MSSAQQGIGGLHVSSNGGSGPPPEPVDLQEAYDNGQSIDTTVLGPVLITAANEPAIDITHAGDTPVGGSAVIPVTMGDITGTIAAFQAIGVDSTSAPKVPVVRVVDLDGSVWFRATGEQVDFVEGDGTDTRKGVFQSLGGRPLCVRSGRPPGEPGSAATPLELGISNGSGHGDVPLISGGLVVEPDGHITLRKNDTGTLIGDDPRGALTLHNVSAAEDSITPAEGDVYLRTDDGEGNPRERGFRGYRAGNYGLIGRVFQMTFTDADLADRILNVPHELQTLGCIVAVYDQDGLNLPSGVGTWFASDDGSENATVVTIDTLLTPITGVWRVTILGV